MYLRKMIFENIGPIKSLHLDLPFINDSPMPLIVVGTNGTGKSILLSYIADALIEMQKKCFDNVVEVPGAFFRITGNTNQTVGSSFGISVIQFTHDNDPITYFDKSGTIQADFLRDITLLKFPQINLTADNNNIKEILGVKKDILKKIFTEDSFCYFPANRNETPHWFNSGNFRQKEGVKFHTNFNNKINKPLVIESSISENKAWIMDIFLDSLIDINLEEGTPKVINPNVYIYNLMGLYGRKNINIILQTILQNTDLSLALNLRNDMNSRLCIKSEKQIVIPSIDHLSTGQITLLNMILTIVRYSDSINIVKSVNLEKIKGIVIIDEIDAHLHIDLQFNILPKLIKLFPKVQFIISSHAPAFLLGMDATFGGNNYKIIEMPKGEEISVECFSEFKHAFECISISKTFEKIIKEKIESSQKPLVLMEGETDPIYLSTAIKLLGKEDILQKIDIDWVGANNGKGQNFNTGDTGLNNTYSVLKANPFLVHKKVMLLYDSDTNKPSSDEGKIFVRKIEYNTENKEVTKGIENLLPQEVFTDEYYITKEIKNAYGKKNTIIDFQKMKLCKYLCNDKKDPNDFVKFKSVISILDDFISSIVAD